MNDHGNSSASKVDILFLNVEGINNDRKRHELFLHISKRNPAVVCLCDTRLNDNGYVKIANEQSFHCKYSKVENAARGVCILIRKNFPIKIVNSWHDNIGNWVCVEIEYDNRHLNIHCIYGPNTDSPDFFENIFNFISNNNITDNIIVGDFNVTLNTQLDNMNYVQDRNNNARRKLGELIEQFGFYDVYRSLHGTKKNYTWFNRGGRQRARLDMAIASNSIRPFITSYQSLPMYKNDHRPQMITLDYTVFKRGKGYWKLNNSLLNDIEFVNKVKETINCTCSKYFISPFHENFLIEASVEELDTFKNMSPEELQAIPYNVNPNVLLDMILNDIKNAAVVYSTRKSRLEREEETRLWKEITKYQDMKSAGLEAENLDAQILASKQRYESFIEDKSERAVFRGNGWKSITFEIP